MDNFDRIKLSSVPLHSIQGAQCKPIGIASGCIVQYPKNDYLLTVFHAVSKNVGTWAVLSEWIPGKGTKYIRVDGFTFQRLIKIDFKSEIINSFEKNDSGEIDFAFSVFPKGIENLYQEIGTDMRIHINEVRSKFEYTDIVQPNHDSSYGFSGQVMPRIIEDIAIETENKVYQDLKYLKTVDNYHYFELPYKHPGHEYFMGCSGAPIIDEQGNIVSLVCAGDTPNLIIGINLDRFKIAIEIEEGMI